MESLKLQLFGRFAASSESRPINALTHRRARELCAYLVLRRSRPHLRENLATVLWEDIAPDQARKYLRQALWQLRTELHLDRATEAVQPLQVDADWIQIQLVAGCRLDIDVVRFEDAVQSCRGVAGSRLDAVQRQRLEEAVLLYRGELLEGWNQDWCLQERERLREAFLDSLEKLVSSCEARGELDLGLAHARRLLELDPVREQVHCHVMRMLVQMGNRSDALREYRRCENSLLQELNVKPGPTTTALYESIRDGSAELAHGARTPSPAEAALGLPLDNLCTVLERLLRLQDTCAGIEARMNKDISRPSMPLPK